MADLWQALSIIYLENYKIVLLSRSVCEGRAEGHTRVRGKDCRQMDVSKKERKLYFLTEHGTVKARYRIEDEEKRILYEAKMTKFTVAAP